MIVKKYDDPINHNKHRNATLRRNTYRKSSERVSQLLIV